MKAEDVRIILERTFQMPVSESDAQIILDKVLALQAAVKDAPMILTDTPRPWSEGDMQSRRTKRAPDVGYCTCPQSVPWFDIGDGPKCNWCKRPRR